MQPHSRCEKLLKKADPNRLGIGPQGKKGSCFPPNHIPMQEPQGGGVISPVFTDSPQGAATLVNNSPIKMWFCKYYLWRGIMMLFSCSDSLFLKKKCSSFQLLFGCKEPKRVFFLGSLLRLCRHVSST